MESLAEFIQVRREKVGLSITGLANKTNIKLEILEDIESGKELFLSVTQRQQLARVLKCSHKELKIVLLHDVVMKFLSCIKKNL